MCLKISIWDKDGNSKGGYYESIQITEQDGVSIKQVDGSELKIKKEEIRNPIIVEFP